VAVGLFIGSQPLYGLHFPLCVAACVPLRLDVVTAYIAANISNPLFAPFLLALEVEVGSLVLDGRHVGFDVKRATELGVSGYALQTAVGALIVGAALALLGALVTRQLVREKPHQAQLEAAIDRTLARYAAAPRGDRFYVSAKLRSDPVVETVLGLEGSFGKVVDVATGRGQLGLLLLELGRATSLVGFDLDARKIAVAKQAAREDAELAVADLVSLTLPRADTFLFVDVLHYLPEAEQRKVLERAVKSLETGGRILVRDVDPKKGLRGRLTMFAERIAKGTGYNKGNTLMFREPERIVADFAELGLSSQILSASTGTPLSNVLILAERRG
jgi:SAM-dependent methyltransferase